MSKILVVDDDKNINILIQSLLKNENYEVVVAFDGVEALEKIESGHAYYRCYDAEYGWLGTLRRGAFI